MSKNKKFSGSFLKFVAGLNIAWGAFVSIFGSIGATIQPNETVGELIVGLLLIGVAPIIFGVYLWKKGNARKDEEPEIESDIERKVLIAAQRRGGVLTATALSLETGISIEQSRKALEYMTKQGLAIPEATDEGAVVYKFIEMLND